MLIVTPNNFNRPTAKNIDAVFTLRYKADGKFVKVSISPETIKLWRDKFSNYNLVEVQNAMNKLAVIYQTPDEDDIKMLLQNPDYIKIKRTI